MDNSPLYTELLKNKNHGLKNHKVWHNQKRSHLRKYLDETKAPVEQSGLRGSSANIRILSFERIRKPIFIGILSTHLE